LRITNSILYSASLAGVQKNLRDIHAAQAQVVTGSRIQKVSDDPVAAGDVLRSDGNLRALDQYRRNIGAARSRLSMEESVLDQLGDVVSRARELAVGQGTDTANAETRSVARQELAQLLDFARQLANTTFGGAYLFGGARSDRPPLDTPSTPGAQGARAEIGTGQTILVNHGVDEVFFTPESREEGLLPALEALVHALETDDVEAIRTAAPTLARVFDRVQDLLGDVGARANLLDIASSNIEALEINLRTFKSDVQDIDFEEAVSQLVGRQLAFEAALLANSRILQTTLMDYLR
jgi:flagellar hook-associated protein 3 FlgL